MRPSLDVDRLFRSFAFSSVAGAPEAEATKNEERSEPSETSEPEENDELPDTERAPEMTSALAHSIVLPACEPHEPEPRKAHALTDLDSFLAARVLRFELVVASRVDTARLAAARTLRSALARVAEQIGTVPREGSSFAAAVSETVRGLYAWAFGELDALFGYEPRRWPPKRLLVELANHAEQATLGEVHDSPLAPLENALAELSESAKRFAKS
jgi:hypothetical protein